MKFKEKLYLSSIIVLSFTLTFTIGYLYYYGTS